MTDCQSHRHGYDTEECPASLFTVFTVHTHMLLHNVNLWAHNWHSHIFSFNHNTENWAIQNILSTLHCVTFCLGHKLSFSQYKTEK